MLNGAKTFQDLREKTKNVVREASNKETSSFEPWSSDSLKRLLIAHNVQVRGSKLASHSTLVRICQDLFGDKYKGRENEFVKVYTMDEIIQMDKAARSIQWGYIDYQQRQKQPKRVHNLVIDVIASPKQDSQEYVLQHTSSKDRRNSIYTYEEDLEKGRIEFRDEKDGHRENGSLYAERDIEHDNHGNISEVGIHYAVHDERDIEHDQNGPTVVKAQNDRRQFENQRYHGKLSKKRSSLDSGALTEPSSVSMSTAQGMKTRDKRCKYEKPSDNETWKTARCESIEPSKQRTTHKERKKNGNNIESTHDVKRRNGSQQSSSSKTYPPDHIDVIMTTPRRRNSSLGHGSETKSRAKSLEEELDMKWVKPSWALAKEFEAENRPHRSGKGMRPYNWRTVTLGRHCTVGGCGEQLDLWDEGQMSEFAQFGSGVTNYFKVCIYLNLS
jgi:hypothetical protein